MTATETSAETGKTASGAGGWMSTSTGVGMASETASGTTSSSGGSRAHRRRLLLLHPRLLMRLVVCISSPEVRVVVSLAAGFFASFLV
jgi:hypothetical protein